MGEGLKRARDAARATRTPGPTIGSLQDDMAAVLQARLSWPQADGCAADLIAMFGRRMHGFPLTCEYCTHAPASHLLVADLPVGRAAHLVCGPCGTRSVEDARKIAKSASSAWLFALIPVTAPTAGKDGER